MIIQFYVSWCCLCVFLNGFLVNALLMLFLSLSIARSSAWCFFLLDKEPQFSPSCMMMNIFGWKLYHNYMFNVLFLQTIIIHPEKYNLPLLLCIVYMEWDVEWEKEGISMESTWAPADPRILHYFTVYTHKWDYNETMIRCSLSSFSFAFYTNKYDMFLLLLSSLLPSSFCVLLLRILKAIFVGIKKCCKWERKRDDKWILWNATKKRKQAKILKLEMT